MHSVTIDTTKAHAVPPSLLEWTSRAHKGPRTLVAEMCMGADEPAPEPCGTAHCYTLKGWTKDLGPRAMLAHRVA